MAAFTLILIPPSGRFKKQDFSLDRIATACRDMKNLKVVLLHVHDEKNNIDQDIYDEIVSVDSENTLFDKLRKIKYDKILHRSWMHNYSFAKELVEKFENVIVNIKDWNFSTKEEYEFLFGDTSDFEAIEYIFKNCDKVLSHFTQEQALLWSEQYDVNADKFIFFPEYCNKEFFYDKEREYKNIHLVYAGKIQKSTYPEQLFPSKSNLRSILKLTQQKINIDYVLPEQEYNEVVRSKKTFLDFLYEDRFNKRFHLIRGEKLNPSVLQKYHFGFFELEVSGINTQLYKYAVVSKFAFYLESCLPILVNREFVSIAAIVQKYNLGIVFTNDDLHDFYKVLDITQNEYDRYIKNIKNYRKFFTYEKKMESLIKG